MRAFDAVVFDFGHTLFDSKPPSSRAAEFRDATGQELDEEALAAVLATIRERSRQPDELAKGRDLSAALHRKCWLELLAPLDELAPGLALFNYELESSARGWEPYPDARPVLTELRRRGIPVGILSDCGWDVREVFKLYGLDELVRSFDLSYEHGVCKPAPEIFRAACSQLSVDPSRALMVGDSPLTDGGAAAVGMMTLVLPAGDRTAHPALSHVLDLAH